MAALIETLDRLNRRVGEFVAWLLVAMVIVTFAVVVLRYAFDVGWVWVQESVTWMHACVFMLAAAYTLACDDHVRVDVFYRDMSPRRRAIVDLAGTVLFLLPVTAFLLVTGFEYAAVSWRIGETSREAGGLPFPWPSLMKTAIPAASLMLMLQGVVIAGRAVIALRNGEPAEEHDESVEHKWPG